MANQQEQLAAFIQWLPENISKLQGQVPDEIIQPIAEAQSAEDVVSVLNQLSQSDEGNQLVQGLFAAFQQSQTGMFKEGGKLAYGLQKLQTGRALRNRGKVNAYRGRSPEFNQDSTWTYNNGAYVKNIFNGNTLKQNVVTMGEWGVPRRTVRIITNYDMPAKSDTTYIDANGDSGKRNPNFLDKLLGNAKHSALFMNNVDAKLVGMEPMQLSEREVKATELKKKKK